MTPPRPSAPPPVPLPARLAPLALALLLAGCTAVAPDGGFGDVADQVQARVGAVPVLARDDAAERDIVQTVHGLLAEPLDMDRAVRIALLANPGLQASYHEVGIAQADVAQAGRLPNPTLAVRRLGAGGALEIERALTFDLADLLLKPLSMRLEARRFEGVKLEVAVRIERHALDTRRAWVEAVAAAQSLAYARTVRDAAETGADLADRMARAGNLSQLDLARERLHYADAGATLARAAREAVRTRERLTRMLGVWGEDAHYTLPDRLPDLPAEPAAPRDAERIALEQRLDVHAARLAAAATASDLGLTKTTRFVNVLDLGPANRTTSGEATMRGYELSVSVPLFDWGGARVARAEATYMASVRRVADAAVTARSEARDAYIGYRSAYDLARHYRDVVIPLRKRVGKEVLLRYNGMLVGPQDLLADAREQAEAVTAAIDALRGFWLAQADLEAALGLRAADWPAPAASTAAASTHEQIKQKIKEPTR